MEKRKKSDSKVQREIEEKVLKAIQKELNDDTLKSDKVYLDDDKVKFVLPDFISDDSKTVGEIHAHIGRLKGAQPGKIAKDILKMLLIQEVCGCDYEKYIVVCDQEEFDQLNGDSFLAEVIKRFRIKVRLIRLDDSDYERLKKCMRDQNLMIDADETI